MNESKKHRDFVGEPMGHKPVTALAGIGVTLGALLNAEGYRFAHKVLGQYLILDKNGPRFRNWLRETCNANDEQCRDCCNCLEAWCAQHL